MNDNPRRTAVVIGASSGIGEALARELDRLGRRLGLLAGWDLIDGGAAEQPRRGRVLGIKGFSVALS